MLEGRLALDVGIVGSGYAGCAAALLLERAGQRVTLYEEVLKPCGIGAGIVLQPTGMRVLAELGLLEDALCRGARLESLLCRTSNGRTLVDLRYAELGNGLFGLGMHRGALFELLYDAVTNRNISVRCGTRVGSFSQVNGRVVVFDERQRPLGEHDLVVVADGARSALRSSSALTRAARVYPWGALWFVARDPERISGQRLSQVTRGTRQFLGLLPSGLGPRSSHESVPLVSLFWSIRLDGLDGFRRAGLFAFKRDVLALDSNAAFILDQIESIDQLLVSSYLDVVMNAWHTENVVYIGDAGHAMSPQLGQGCNLALEDASVLAACVGECNSRREALGLYSELRRHQLRFYQFATRWLTPFFQSDFSVLGWLRDALMGPACRFAPMRRQMLRTMVGVKRGLLRGGVPLDSICAALPAHAKAAASRDLN